MRQSQATLSDSRFPHKTFFPQKLNHNSTKHKISRMPDKDFLTFCLLKLNGRNL